MKSSIGKMTERFFRLLAPPRDLTISQWADKYRYLSPESASEPGKWKTLPFQRTIMDSISDRSIHRTVVKACTQLIKTEAILNSIGYFVHQDPGPILVLQPRDADAKAFSKERIAPMIRDTPVLRGLFMESKGRNSNNTIEEKMFPGGMLAITSAGSAPNLARRAIRFLFCDEVDKYPDTAGAEGNPISLARKRLATFRHRKKEIMTCSPTLPGSEIDRTHDGSDKREYYIPCPDCGQHQSMMLKFYKQVQWDSSLPTQEAQAATARYCCEHCGSLWDDVKRWQAVERGEWRAHGPFNGVAGFWISELYSPWKTLSEIVLDFLNKKDNAQDLRTFVNTSLAENWAEKGEAPEWEILLSRREDYVPGTVPAGGLFLTAGVDVQRNRLECEVVAWGRGKESWSVDYEIFEGKTSEPEVWKQLEAYRSKIFTASNGAELPIARMFVDSGDGTTTNDVYSWVRTQPSSQVTAIKGRDRNSLPVGQPSEVDVTVRGRKIKSGLRIKIVDVSFFKGEFYANLRLRPPTEEERKIGLCYPPSYCHFPSGRNYGDEHFRQICAEQLVSHRNRRTGRTKMEWQQTRARNEALDCRIYARAAAWDRGLDRMQESHFQALEAQLGSQTGGKADIKPQEKKAPRQPPWWGNDPYNRDARSGSSWLGDRTRDWFRR